MFVRVSTNVLYNEMEIDRCSSGLTSCVISQRGEMRRTAAQCRSNANATQIGTIEMARSISVDRTSTEWSTLEYAPNPEDASTLPLAKLACFLVIDYNRTSNIGRTVIARPSQTRVPWDERAPFLDSV